VNDDVHDLLDRVLPEGPVPFTVEAPRVIAAGRRLRRRRRATTVSGVLAGVCAVALAVVLAPSIFASTNTEPGDGDRSSPSAGGEGWDVPNWNRQERRPLHSESTTKVAGALADTFAANAADVSVHGQGEKDTVDFGRFTETSRDGGLTRKLLYSQGWVADKHGSDADYPSDYEVSIYEPGLVGSPKELVDCHAKGNACSWKTGESFPILKVTHTANSGGLRVASYAVYVLRGDKTVAKFVLTPAIDKAPSSTDKTIKPVLAADEMVALTLDLPGKLKV
jgi:hypothetical protein